MDGPWIKTIKFLTEAGLGQERIVAPAEMAQRLPGVIGYGDAGALAPSDVAAVVIHKGLYQDIPAHFLAGFMQGARPVFANPVFIVLAVAGQALKTRNPHLGALRDIRRWLIDTLGPEAAGDLGNPSLSGDAALDRMVRFIANHLIKPIDPRLASSPLAVAETAERFNDSAWFWVDDSGKAAELFAAPQIRNARPDIADALLGHVLRLSADHIMHRRSAVPELRLVDDSAQAFSAYNCFFRCTGDLVSGAVRPAIRFNDDRTRFMGEFAGHSLEFWYGLRRHVVDIETCITDWAIDAQDGCCVFSHTSTISGRGLIGALRPIATLTYRYTFASDRPTIGLEVELQVRPGVRLHGVRMTTAIDQLSSGGNFDELRIGAGGAFRDHGVPSEPRAQLHAGPADYLGINESNYSPLSESAGIPGFAHGFHIAYHDGARIEQITANGSREGRFHWIRTFYRIGTVSAKAPARLREDRLMTGGGYYAQPEIYQALLAAPPAPAEALDPAMSYDIGAELNAVAVTLLFNGQGRYDQPLTEERTAFLRSWFDRHLAIYRQSLDRYGDRAHAHVFLRGLAFVILALDAMTRAFPDGTYAADLAHFTTMLSGCESRVAEVEGESIFSGQLDCHCAAILAFARAATLLPVHAAQLGEIIGRALRGIKAGEVPGEVFGHAGMSFTSLYIRPRAGQRAEDAGFWVFKLGLALRAFNAVDQAIDKGAFVLDAATRTHMTELATTAFQALGEAARAEGDELEILTSHKSNETNSETQPWVALGIAPVIEWEIFGRPDRVATLETRDPPAAERPRFPEFDRMSRPVRIDWQCDPAQMAALAERVAETWEELGRERPHWSVMSNDEFLPEHIDQTEAQFHASGKADLDRLVATIERCGRRAEEFPTVLEFGCGLGRITNHLAERFERVLARDISQPHLDLAARHSTAQGHGETISYGLARMPDFGMDQPFDLWFSVIVLQHNPPPIMAQILARVFAMLRPGGLAVFQLPTYAARYRFALDTYLASERHANAFEMHCLPQSAVFALAADAGCRVIEVVEDHVVGDPDWMSNVIVIGKPR